MKVIKNLIVTLLIIILFFCSTILLILIPIKKEINDNFTKNILTSINFEKMIEENPRLKEGIDKTLKPIYDETEKYGVNEDLIIKIFNSKEVKELIGDISDNVIKAIISGKDTKIISEENIEDVISDTIDDINTNNICNIGPEVKEEILKVTKKELNKIQNYIPDTSLINENLSKQDKQKLKIVRFILFNKFLGIVLAITIVSLSVIFLLKRKSKHKFSLMLIPILIPTIISLLVTLVMHLFIATYNLNYLESFLKTNYYLDIILVILIISILILAKITPKNKEI